MDQPIQEKTAESDSRPATVERLSRRTASSGLGRILDLIYPPRCVSCGAIGQQALCTSCGGLISRLYPPLCRQCSTPLKGAHCARCSNLNLFFEVGAAYGTYEGVLRQAILNLKYRRWLRAVQPLSSMLIEAFQSDWNTALQTVECVVPVPIHPRRLSERGFNQSERIALPLCHVLGLPLLRNALQRILFTRPQVGLRGTKRWENVMNAFKVAEPEQVRGKHVLLIDDVMTTGGTLNACAQALKEAGAIHVSVLTLAKEVIEDNF